MSGTTGKPKGVMLSHRNVVANVVAALARVAAHEGDRFLSFLPLSHTFERTAGYYLPMAAGACVAFARSTPLLAEDMLPRNDRRSFAVPRIFERVQSRLQETIAGSTVQAFASSSRRRPSAGAGSSAARARASPVGSPPSATRWRGRCSMPWWRDPCASASAAGCGLP